MYAFIELYEISWSNNMRILVILGSPRDLFYITRTSLFKYTENFTTKKMKVFRWKILKCFIFLLKT